MGPSPQPNEHRLIMFDADYNIRILDADQHAASARLRDSCAALDAHVHEVGETAASYIRSFQRVAACVEAEKLRAIGLRNRVAAMHEEEERERAELEMAKAIKQTQLEGLRQEGRSLQKVSQEQEAQLARLKGTAAA